MLKLKEWMNINMLIGGSLSLSDWLGKDPWREKWGLEPLLLRAIAYTADVLSQEIKSQRQKQIEDLKQTMESKPLPSPSIATKGISEYFR